MDPTQEQRFARYFFRIDSFPHIQRIQDSDEVFLSSHASLWLMQNIPISPAIKNAGLEGEEDHSASLLALST
jgi:hypothetical protein